MHSMAFLGGYPQVLWNLRLQTSLITDAAEQPDTDPVLIPGNAIFFRRCSKGQKEGLQRE
jgi:hypothetical protein